MKTRSEAEMLIRAKISDVFHSFTEPEKLTEYWLNRASGPLKPKARVKWEFLVPKAHDTVRVVRFERNRRLTLQWSDRTSTDLHFRKYAPGLVHVTVTTLYRGKNAVANAIGNTQGYAIVLCDLKSLLETGKSGGMVRDKARLIASRLRR